MGQNTLILRFIDLGLLVLLGFLHIADIVQESHLVVQPPPDRQAEQEQVRPVELLVSRRPDGVLYMILDETEQQVCVARSREALRGCLQEGMRLALKLDRTAQMQDAVDALDVCKETNAHCGW